MQEIVYLVFNDAINDQTVNRFIDVTSKAIAQYQPKALYFLFSSGGGFVNPGLALYNYLRALPQETVMHNMGSIDSIANAVFLAGKKRYASPTSAFLLHGISWTFQAQSSLSYVQMQESLSRFDAAEQLTAKIVGEHTKLTMAEVRALFRQGESKNPQFALDKGLIHDICEAKIQQGAPVHSIVPGA
jgi:ATP-dependent protease ClpP protease subunit